MVVLFAWIKPPSVVEVEAAAEDSVEAVEDTVEDAAEVEVDTAGAEEDTGEEEVTSKVDAPVVEDTMAEVAEDTTRVEEEEDNPTTVEVAEATTSSKAVEAVGNGSVATARQSGPTWMGVER